MKYFIFALLLFAAGIGVAQLDGETQTYVPVVRVRTSEGFFVTAVQSSTGTKKACGESLERFLRPLEKSCPGCTIESSSCAAELAGMELALAKGEEVPVYTVTSNGVRLALVGPPQAVRRTCEQIVAHAQLMGTKNASCVLPR